MGFSYKILKTRQVLKQIINIYMGFWKIHQVFQTQMGFKKTHNLMNGAIGGTNHFYGFLPINWMGNPLPQVITHHF